MSLDRITARIAALLVTAAVVATSCATSDSGDQPTSLPSSTTTAVPPTTSTTQPAPAALELAETDIGVVLVDSTGRTVYLFDPDGQGESTCYDTCAAAWPALTGTFGAGEGVDPHLLGSVPRTDGSMQVTYGGWPLYLYSGDATAGDTNGQGVNDVWWTVSVYGDAVGRTATLPDYDDDEFIIDY